MNKTLYLESGKFYHIYNQGNAKENLFREPENYRFFLQKFEKYISPVAETMAYCLLPNHFHFLLKIKDVAIPESKTGTSPSDYINQQFSNFFNSYSKAFNKKYDRVGKLFALPFKRILVKNDQYLSSLIVYIHRNPIHHCFTDHFNEWPYSSYHAYISNEASWLNLDYMIYWFGSRDQFVKTHIDALNDFRINIYL